MLVDNESMIEKIFTEVPGIITVHAENEDIIQKKPEILQAKIFFSDSLFCPCRHPLCTGLF
jgi:hypothetical protein